MNISANSYKTIGHSHIRTISSQYDDLINLLICIRRQITLRFIIFLHTVVTPSLLPFVTLNFLYLLTKVILSLLYAPRVLHPDLYPTLVYCVARNPYT